MFDMNCVKNCQMSLTNAMGFETANLETKAVIEIVGIEPDGTVSWGMGLLDVPTTVMYS